MASLPLPSGYTPSLIPAVAIAVQLGVGANASPSSDLTTILLGNKTSAGSVAVHTPVDVFSPEDADWKFGGRSELAHACRSFFKTAPRGKLSACAVAENGSGVAATATLLFAGPATAAGSVRIRVDGRRMTEVAFASGASASSIASAVEAQLDLHTDWPCTAGVSTATVTLTSANVGPRGNNHRIECEIVPAGTTATGVTVDLNGASAASTKVTGRFGTDSATAGSGADDFTSALAAIYPTRYDFIGAACDDDTNRGLVVTHAQNASAITAGRRCRAVCGSKVKNGVSTVVDDAAAANEARFEILLDDNGWRSTGEMVGAYCAGRIYGDGRLPGLIAYRAAKHNGLDLPLEENDLADRLTETELATLLAGGVTVLMPSSRKPGYMRVVRPVTTRTKNASGGTSYAVIDPSKVLVADLIADRIQAFAEEAYADKNLAPDPVDIESAPSSPYVTWPSAIREDILAILRKAEGDGLLVDVDAHASEVLVTISDTDNTVAVASVPTAVIPHFHTLVTAVQQIG